MQHEPGEVILNGKYRIEAFIGQGAFAQVMQANLAGVSPLTVIARDHTRKV